MCARIFKRNAGYIFFHLPADAMVHGWLEPEWVYWAMFWCSASITAPLPLAAVITTTEAAMTPHRGSRCSEDAGFGITTWALVGWSGLFQLVGTRAVVSFLGLNRAEAHHRTE
jgi:sterol desaturase/sphingolipid hydroxylase (fatty acid hydroxylase superfamily)